MTQVKKLMATISKTIKKLTKFAQTYQKLESKHKTSLKFEIKINALNDVLI